MGGGRLWEEVEEVIHRFNLVIGIPVAERLLIKALFLSRKDILTWDTNLHDEIDAKTYDLTIKTSDDKDYVKNIEVKQVTTNNPSQLAKNIKRAFEQVGDGGTVALYLPERDKNSRVTRDFINNGYQEAMRKGFVKGSVEVWFDDKTKIDL